MPAKRKAKRSHEEHAGGSSPTTKKSKKATTDTQQSGTTQNSHEKERDDTRSEKFKVAFADKEIDCKRQFPGADSQPFTKPPSLIYTHGAGGGLDNAGMVAFMQGFASVDTITCFKGSINLKSRIKFFHAVVEHEHGTKARNHDVAALGGQSMGARAAVITASESESINVKALVLQSYPLVGAAKGDVRDQILLNIAADVDVLFITGTRDSMCDISHLNEVRSEMKAVTWLVEVNDADHGSSVRTKAGVDPVRQTLGMLAAKWLKHRDRDARFCPVAWDDSRNEVYEGNWIAEKEKADE